jgi:hypothetical protein
MSGRSGQRIASLAALDSARRHYTNRAQLRHEATAALTLMDLQKRPDWTADRNGKVTAVSTDLSVAAQAEVGRLGDAVPSHGWHRLGPSPQTQPGATAAAFQPEGKPICWWSTSRAREGTVDGLDWSQRQPLFPSLDHGIMGRAVDFTADETKLAVGRNNGTIEIYCFLRETRAAASHGLASRHSATA